MTGSTHFSTLKKSLLEFYNYEDTIQPFNRVPEGYQIYGEDRRPIKGQYWSYSDRNSDKVNLFFTPSFLSLLVNDEVVDFQNLLLYIQDDMLILTDHAQSVDHSKEPILVYDNDGRTARDLQSPAGQEFLRSVDSKYVMVTVSKE